MKHIKEMVGTAPTKADAIAMLNAWLMTGTITQSQYERGRQLIRTEFVR